MLLRDPRRIWVLGVIASAATWLVSPDASACSCATGSNLEWPAAGQTEVPLDTSIIVSGLGGFATPTLSLVLPVPADAGAAPGSAAADAGGTDLAPLPPVDEPEGPKGLHLVSPNGEVVVLVEQRSYPTTDCTRGYHFYGHDSGDLEPNTKYDLFDGVTLVASFTTGTQRRDREAEVAEAQAIEFETLGTTDNPPRVTTAFVSKVPQAPLFVYYTGSDQEVTYRMRSSQTVTTYDFGAVECPTVEIVGSDGLSLDTRKFCEPDRCKAHPNEIGVTSCGGNYLVGVGYEEFKTLPACTGATTSGTSPSPTSTNAPSTSATNPNPGDESSAPSFGTEGMDDEPGPNKVPLESATDSGGGCSVTSERSSRSTAAWLLGLVAIGVLVRRARR